jgi:predicted HicB family RNase H-like nuclease
MRILMAVAEKTRPTRPAYREGKKSFTVWLDEEFITKIKIDALKRGESVQDWAQRAYRDRMRQPRAKK